MIDIANDRYSFFFTDMDATIKPLSFNYTTHKLHYPQYELRARGTPQLEHRA